MRKAEQSLLMGLSKKFEKHNTSDLELFLGITEINSRPITEFGGSRVFKVKSLEGDVQVHGIIRQGEKGLMKLEVKVSGEVVEEMYVATRKIYGVLKREIKFTTSDGIMYSDREGLLKVYLISSQAISEKYREEPRVPEIKVKREEKIMIPA